MTRAVKYATKGPDEAQSVKIQGGVKNGFKIHLNGPSGQDSNASIQGPKGHNYVITPAGAAKGENISINDKGLYIRAAQNKKQLITATSCPDNQVQVSVGQGKSAVQLSIQVAPQGKRGEVELNCVRTEAENGGTGYTVSVNREADDVGKALPSKHLYSSAELERTPDPSCNSPQAHAAPSPTLPSLGQEIHTCDDSLTQQAQAKEVEKHPEDGYFEQKCFLEKEYSTREAQRIAAENQILQEKYAAKLREILSQKELIQNAKNKRMGNAKDWRFANREYNDDWLCNFAFLFFHCS